MVECRIPKGATCICDRCNCGNHKCPSDVHLKRIPFQGRTSQMIDYKPYDTSAYPKRVDNVRERDLPLSGKFRAETTQQADYRPWNVEARSRSRSKASLPPARPFTGTTTNQSDYIRWDIEPTKKAERGTRPITYVSGLETRRFETTTGSTYLPKAASFCPAIQLAGLSRKPHSAAGASGLQSHKASDGHVYFTGGGNNYNN